MPKAAASSAGGVLMAIWCNDSFATILGVHSGFKGQPRDVGGAPFFNVGVSLPATNAGMTPRHCPHRNPSGDASFEASF